MGRGTRLEAAASVGLAPSSPMEREPLSPCSLRSMSAASDSARDQLPESPYNSPARGALVPREPMSPMSVASPQQAIVCVTAQDEVSAGGSDSLAAVRLKMRDPQSSTSRVIFTDSWMEQALERERDEAVSRLNLEAVAHTQCRSLLDAARKGAIEAQRRLKAQMHSAKRLADRTMSSARYCMSRAKDMCADVERSMKASQRRYNYERNRATKLEIAVPWMPHQFSPRNVIICEKSSERLMVF